MDNLKKLQRGTLKSRYLKDVIYTILLNKQIAKIMYFLTLFEALACKNLLTY